MVVNTLALILYKRSLETDQRPQETQQGTFEVNIPNINR